MIRSTVLAAAAVFAAADAKTRVATLRVEHDFAPGHMVLSEARRGS